jgi:peptidoglycan/xylan/chitin deacetylase (PgdA/CDA1 family)
MAKKRKRKKSKKSSKKIYIVAVLIIILFSYFFINFNKNDGKLISGKFLDNIPLTLPPTITFTPSPTLIPTATPVPLIGYCLNVPVIMYHHIQPDAEAIAKEQKALNVDSSAFDNQMGYLVSHGYSPISAQQLVDALVNHTGLPSKSIVITLDDGYRDNYIYAFPILKKYNIVANMGVITGLVGGVNYVTWDQIKEMSNSGLIYPVNHTWSHYSITQSGDKARYEVATAKQQLQDYTGRIVDTFIYPYGAINSSAIAVLEQEGIRGAFSEISGHWQCDSFIMALHRTRIGNSSLSNYGL